MRASKLSTGARLHDVQRLPLRHALDDVDEDDVGDVALDETLGRRRPDVARSDDRDLEMTERRPSADSFPGLPGQQQRILTRSHGSTEISADPNGVTS